MDFLKQIEGEPAARRIRDAASRGALSHAILLTGEGDRLSLARYAAAAMECTGTAARPCGACPACRKVFRDIHPDVITVRDDAHQSIAADVVRAVRADMWVRPNEGARKVCIFPDCALLTERDQNILLKLVEEGPPYGAFVFCAENASVILQTIRSRCIEWKLRPPKDAARDLSPAARDRDLPLTAERGAELCRRVIRRRGAVAEWAARMEKSRLSREELSALLFYCREISAAALFSRYGRQSPPAYQDLARDMARNLTKRQLASTIEILGNYGGVCAWNVGTGHVLGALAAELEELR